ncbi:hypothetical protein PHAVU_002G244612 [Phaseolus vulgaris]
MKGSGGCEPITNSFACFGNQSSLHYGFNSVPTGPAATSGTRFCCDVSELLSLNVPDLLAHINKSLPVAQTVKLSPMSGDVFEKINTVLASSVLHALKNDLESIRNQISVDSCYFSFSFLSS